MPARMPKRKLWLKRLAKDYLRYYYHERAHDGLEKDAPAKRPTRATNAGDGLVWLPRMGGLHHPHRWEKAS